MIIFLSVIIFLLGYIAISQEHVIKVSKTSISLILAVFLWLLVAIGGVTGIGQALSESGGEILD